MPTRLFFVYKFFNNKNTQTDTVESRKLDESFYLVKEGCTTSQVDQVLESAIQDTYMVTAEDHAPFINYLNTQELAIDVWNADSYQSYAAGSLRLSRALRQG